jgi:DNA-binding Xre family transcriptional regulator
MNYNKLTEDDILNNKYTLNIDDILFKRKFNEDFLSKIIGYANLNTFLITQDLSKEFICKYILNPYYQYEDNEKTITLERACRSQKYSIEEMVDYIKNNNIEYIL